MLFLLDNYDSFTWNLAQAFGALGAAPLVVRNDQTTVAAVTQQRPEAIVISPGPGTPADAGISIELIRAAAQQRIPLLGVCLGHQAIGEAFGGRVIRADRQMHGKATLVITTSGDLFQGIESGLVVMRYHSLIVAPDSVPRELEVTAWSADRPAGTEIMALRHRSAPIWGVQFHPESVGTPAGNHLLSNFLALASQRV
ncbi:MAG: aminodeoxychorismate/anthranilate synthase component II [Gemmatimonadota bacterium]